jgi:manganese transport protein
MVWVMWMLAEVVAMATDLAEFLGAALGMNLLFHIPLLPAGVITGVATFIILGLERRGFRRLEAVITGFVGVIAGSYIFETFIDRPDWGAIGYHALVPQFSGTESVLLATGILGATVMPHVIYLHSALMQGRIVTREPKELARLFRYEIVDVVLAMGLAGLVNAAILIMAASTFHSQGLSEIGTIEEAHRTLEPLLGPAASWVFALSLLASGLSSSTVGTMSGQVIMQGFLHRRIPVWLRRLLTMIPSLAVIAMVTEVLPNPWGLDATRTLVVSQVVLSFGLPFAIIPLVIFTAKKELMGILANHKITTIIASLVAGLIVALNVFLLYQTFFGG